MRRRPRLPVGMFGSEQELCEAFITSARAAGYQVHPECGPWDLLVVCRRTGDQIGIQAKLRLSYEVFSQALTTELAGGPEMHAVLVPLATREFFLVAEYLKIHVFQGVTLDRLDLPLVFQFAKRWTHPVREWAPEVEIATPAGVPSPKKMTRWKMAAVKLCMQARSKGYVTREDMNVLRLSPTWWLSRRNGGILEGRVVNGNRRRGEYTLRDSSSPLVPDLRWPEVVDALLKQAAMEPPAKSPRLRTRKREPEQPPQPRASTIIPPPPSCSDDLRLKPLVPSNDRFPLEDKLVASSK